jgi:hypothetical protein
LSCGVVEVEFGVVLVLGEVVEFVVEELPVVSVLVAPVAPVAPTPVAPVAGALLVDEAPDASVEFGVELEVEFGEVVEVAFGEDVAAPALPLWSVLFGVVLVVEELELPTPVVLPLVPVDCPEVELPGALMSPVEFGFEVEEAPVVLCGAVVVVVVDVAPGGVVVVVVVAFAPACPDVLSGVAVLLEGVALVLLCPDMLPVEVCDASVPLVLGVVVELLGEAVVVELVLLLGYWLDALGSGVVAFVCDVDDWLDMLLF